MHRHAPFTFFPKVYTKHMNPPSPLGKGGVKEIKKNWDTWNISRILPYVLMSTMVSIVMDIEQGTQHA
jgi:hypothetical protein